MPDKQTAPTTHHALLGHILATALLAAIDAGGIAMNPAGVASNPAEIEGIIQGFTRIWVNSAMPKPPTTVQLSALGGAPGNVGKL